MEITSEWALVVLTLMGMSGGFGAWLHAQVIAGRRAAPIIRSEWASGTDGHSVSLHITNTLDEELTIHRAEIDGTFAVNVGAYKPATGSVAPVWEERPSPMKLDWTIAPKAGSRFQLCMSGSRRLTLTMSSSAKTLRRKRLIIRDNQRM